MFGYLPEWQTFYFFFFFFFWFLSKLPSSKRLLISVTNTRKKNFLHVINVKFALLHCAKAVVIKSMPIKKNNMRYRFFIFQFYCQNFPFYHLWCQPARLPYIVLFLRNTILILVKLSQEVKYKNKINSDKHDLPRGKNNCIFSTCCHSIKVKILNDKFDSLTPFWWSKFLDNCHSAVLMPNLCPLRATFSSYKTAIRLFTATTGSRVIFKLKKFSNKETAEQLLAWKLEWASRVQILA